MSVKNIGYLLLLGAIWGGSFLFMRISAPEFGIYALVEVRTVLAALVLLPFVVLKGQWRGIITHWKAIAGVGAVNTAIPFVLFNYSSLHLEVGVNAILNATAPMFGALVAVVWLGDKLTKLSVLGVCLGFLGVSVISMHNVTGASTSLLPIFTALLATLCYGIAASMMKRYLGGKPPIMIAAGSQVYASLFLLPFALMTWPQQMPSSQAWSSAIALAIAGTGLAYLLYFTLIANVGPAKAISVAYLVPMFGIVWGVVFLGEQLSLSTLAGGGLILLGIALTTGVIRLPKR